MAQRESSASSNMLKTEMQQISIESFDVKRLTYMTTDSPR